MKYSQSRLEDVSLRPHKPTDEGKDGYLNGIKEDKVGIWVQYSGSVMNCGIFFRGLCWRKCYKGPWEPTVIHLVAVVVVGGVGVGVMVALRTLVYLTSDAKLQGLCGVARSVACKENRSGEKDQGLFTSISRSLFIMWDINVLACCTGPPPPLPIDRSHYKINVTKIAHNASEKCNTISRSLSSF